MENISTLVNRALSGDAVAYEVLVRRFQDMAVGYGYSMLRDFQLAEDAAQEAFFEAYRNLSKLREPAAFPGWFRLIVFKQCDRIIREKHPATVPLEDVAERASAETGQVQMMEERETSDKIFEAINALPEHERATTMLFYIGGHSLKEVGEFLGVPVSTVKKRLHAARGRLREALFDAFQDTLRGRRPSRDEIFASRVMEILTAARAGDADTVKALLEQDPRLLSARDWLGNSALVVASNSGHQEITELLFAAGVKPDVHEAAAIGRTDLVVELLTRQPGLANAYSAQGATPLALAAHFGHLETVKVLLERGADINAVVRNILEVTPLHAALFGRKREVALYLIECGADVTLKRGGKGMPRAGWTALHYAAAFGYGELVEPLLDRGTDLNSLDDENKTPLRAAMDANQPVILELLRRRGARK